jgi:hypothetical protein
MNKECRKAIAEAVKELRDQVGALESVKEAIENARSNIEMVREKEQEYFDWGGDKGPYDESGIIELENASESAKEMITAIDDAIEFGRESRREG